MLTEKNDEKQNRRTFGGGEPPRPVLNNIHATYQPIVNLTTGETIGWEAFSRINEDNCFRYLHHVPLYSGVIQQSAAMDQRCFENAISQLGRIHSKQKIFLNIQPQSFLAEAFSPEQVISFLAQYGVKPYQIVFEISSRNSFQVDLSFWGYLESLKGNGVQFALDDVGSGRSDFRWIADLRPQYMKLDRQFYQNALSETIMMAMLESMVAFCRKVNICIIAERLESLSEIEHLVDMGVQYGQGYYLARPNFPKKQDVTGYSDKEAASPRRTRKCQLMKINLPIEKYVQTVPVIDRRTSTERLKQIVSSHPYVTAIVMDQGKPVGLLENQHCYHVLCRQQEKDAAGIIDLAEGMEQNFFLTEGSMSAMEVVKMVAKQNMGVMNPPIIVMADNVPAGVVSFQELQEVYVRYQIEDARDANPLSGLPGNLAIQHTLDEHYRIGHPISLIYVDLDYFKSYNDRYGFKKGDQMLLQLSQILSWALRRKGGRGDFLGHIGGDDFVIVTTPEKAVGICQLTIRSFSRLRRSCYSPEEIKQGYVEGLNRSGEKEKIPLSSVSLAIVDCRKRTDYTELPERAAGMKQYAKSIPGDAFVLDRRKPAEDLS